MADSQWIVTEDEAGVRLDKFLAAPDRLGSRGRAAAALERGKVLVNEADAALGDAARRLAPGDVVRLWVDRPGSAKPRLAPAVTGDLRIVHEDRWLVLVDKPAGLLTVPLDTAGGPESVYDRLEARYRSHGKQRPFVVHRIDRDTSGLVLFARDAHSGRLLQAQFRRREPERLYLAIVHGVPEPETGVWRNRVVLDEAACIQREADPGDPQGEEAISHYRVLERFALSGSIGGAALLEVRLQTGKRNQIRFQAGVRGHVLAGEPRYLFGLDPQRAIRFPRQALHACRLGFAHPHDRRALRFESPLPADLAALVERLRRG
jgi:23S rRNA pseudouridine1911/1915/1917 synthase